MPDDRSRSADAAFHSHRGNLDARILYLSPSDPELAKGDRVRILGGPFAGVEGRFVRIKQARERRVVVLIEGIAAVATTSVPSVLVEKIL